MELRHMREQNIVCDAEPKLREKGGYEQCITHASITHAKGKIVQGIMSKSNKTHRGRIVLSHPL
jgi:hypothetical protein